jgi:glycosyltransferase involved in cell wall biosynthesis
MRIGIDYTAAVNQRAGIGRYARQMVQALLGLDAENEYVLMVPAGTPPGVSSGVARSVTRASGQSREEPQVRELRLPLTERALAVLWHRLRFPLGPELLTGRLDLFHSPDFALPPIRRARTLVTVHDLSFIRVPECSAPSLRSYLMRVVPRSVSRADVVLADSESTRNDVLELLPVHPERVHVVYAGVDSTFRRVLDQATLDAVRARYLLPARFVLSVGTLQPRKNYVRLIEAFHQVSRDTDAGLVISGAPGWMYGGIFRRVDELGLGSKVLFPGYVAEADLPALYSLAEVFAFPSLYEGFGLPPLEAMACGTPVVASNTSSLPEVVGDAAWLVDPLDVSALADALRSLLEESPLRTRQVQRGLAQAQRFTWSAAAHKLLRLYRGAA